MSRAAVVVKDLAPRELAGLKRRAKESGVTPPQYLRELLQNDLEVERLARTMTFDELAAPFREAMRGVSEEEIDEIVNAARARLRRQSKPQRRRGKGV